VIEPRAIHAPVTVDFANMTLVVRRPEDAGGYERLLWRESHAALAAAEEAGWPWGTRFVWGSAPNSFQFAHATPGPNLTLLFAFQPGTAAATTYAELVGRPGLSAFVTADKSTRCFLGVTFRHSPVSHGQSRGLIRSRSQSME
jgi:hypothetical protein